MTDKTRELLERALESFDYNGVVNDFVFEEIRAYLAEPEVPLVRLTEEEISEMAQKCFIRREAGQYHIPYGTTDFARAIEDALEEKNK